MIPSPFRGVGDGAGLFQHGRERVFPFSMWVGHMKGCLCKMGGWPCQNPHASAQPHARARRTGKGGRTQAKGKGLVPAGFRHGRLKVSVMALNLSGAGVTTMLRKGYSPGRLRNGGSRFSLADDTLPASARASPPTFTVIVARCCRSASGQRGVHRHNASDAQQ